MSGDTYVLPFSSPTEPKGKPMQRRTVASFFAVLVAFALSGCGIIEISTSDSEPQIKGPDTSYEETGIIDSILGPIDSVQVSMLNANNLIAIIVVTEDQLQHFMELRGIDESELGEDLETYTLGISDQDAADVLGNEPYWLVVDPPDASDKWTDRRGPYWVDWTLLSIKELPVLDGTDAA